MISTQIRPSKILRTGTTDVPSVAVGPRVPRGRAPYCTTTTTTLKNRIVAFSAAVAPSTDCCLSLRAVPLSFHQNGKVPLQPEKLFPADGAKKSGTSPVNVSASGAEVGMTTVEHVGL